MQYFVRHPRARAILASFTLAPIFALASVVVLDSTQTLAAATNDPLIDQQWGLNAIGAPSVWNITRGAGVTIAVIDSGSGPHPDLDANLDVGRTMFGSIDTVGMIDVDSKLGHGSHVAGIIAAVADNGIGGAGVAPQSRILPIRVLDAKGSGKSDDVSKAVRFAVDSGARIINLSLGGVAQSALSTSAFTYAVDHNVLVVAAAGNDGIDSLPKWPGSSDLTLAVTAIDRTNSVASFDQRGDYIDLAAPGVSIVSTANNEYTILSGTSMAAAFVSGAAALLISAQPSITAAQVRTILQDTATDVGAIGRDSTFGYGVINLVAAFVALDIMFPRVITATMTTEGRIGALAVGTASLPTATFASQWYRCTEAGPAAIVQPANCSAIANAVATTYQSTIKDLRKFLRYTIIYTAGTTVTTYFSATIFPESGAWINTSTIAAKSITPLNQLIGSPSQGRRTVKVLDGTCKVRNSRIVASPSAGACTLKISIAAKAPFPVLGFTTIVMIQ